MDLKCLEAYRLAPRLFLNFHLTPIYFLRCNTKCMHGPMKRAFQTKILNSERNRMRKIAFISCLECEHQIHRRLKRRKRYKVWFSYTFFSSTHIISLYVRGGADADGVPAYFVDLVTYHTSNILGCFDCNKTFSILACLKSARGTLLLFYKHETSKDDDGNNPANKTEKKIQNNVKRTDKFNFWGAQLFAAQKFENELIKVMKHGNPACAMCTTHPLLYLLCTTWSCTVRIIFERVYAHSCACVGWVSVQCARASNMSAHIL